MSSGVPQRPSGIDSAAYFSMPKRSGASLPGGVNAFLTPSVGIGPGRHGVDRDPVPGPLERQRAGQRVHAGLGGGGVGHQRPAPIVQRHRDRDDSSAALRLHQRVGRLATVEGAVQVGFHHGPPGIGRKSGAGSVEVSGRVVDQYVEPAVLSLPPGPTMRATDSGSRTLTSTALTLAAASARSCSAAGSRCSGFRLAMATSAPAAASEAAMPKPIPVPPPVTSATRPRRRSGRNTLRGTGSRSLSARGETRGERLQARGGTPGSATPAAGPRPRWRAPAPVRRPPGPE